MLYLNGRGKAAMGTFKPRQGKGIKVIDGDAKPLLMLAWDFTPPASDTNAGGAHGVQSSQVFTRFDQPTVLQGISEEQDRTGSRRRHGGVEETWTGSFGGTSWHVRGTRLIGTQFNQRPPFHPKVHVRRMLVLRIAHEGRTILSLKTAPMPGRVSNG